MAAEERSSAVSVFPTPVGVFLPECHAAHTMPSLPHARGGVSHWCARQESNLLSSPRPWGCFLVRSSPTPAKMVFPTPVGVFPGKKV